jgi:glycerol transport system ATP-binding protein
LTVIDPHLKWQLRRKLKQIHHELKLTLVYVTHDQIEALTFADQVVVMTRGRAVQVGAADALFERPSHTFVGHFIGSPGMNFLHGQCTGDAVEVAGRRLAMPDGRTLPTGPLTVGIRPEYLELAAAEAPGALPGRVERVQDVGTHVLLTVHVDNQSVKLRLPPAGGAAPDSEVWLQVMNEHTCFYRNEELV